MRLFLVAVGMLALAGCSRGSETGVGAVRVELFYATFRPGCLTVTAQDEADPSRTETQQLPVEERHSDDKTVAVFRKADWGRTLRVTASAREASCSGAEVATSSQVVEVPEEGTRVVYLDLRAEDLDGDGYVSKGGKGTDCDDTDATVHPNASETCDGKDSNCSGGEDDAADKRGFYADADGDGYGNGLSVTFACRPPAGTVAEPGDCHDGDANVRPGRAEPRCDGQDEDCDGTADDDFELGTACETELGCAGTRVCRGDLTAAVCSSTQSPTAWYVDGDGDGRAGTLVAASCKAPPGAVATSNDCDDTSRFIGGTEVCDKLDDNCDGRVDEGSVCGSHAWTAHSLLGVTSTWAAVAAHGPGQVWLAGAGGRLEHVSLPSTTQVPVSSCAGDWRAAWARPSDGRVFLGSAQGELATTTLASGAACPKASVEGVTSAINGMVGMERDGVTTVYAVTSGGHVLRWEWPDAQATPSAPVVMERLAANLRSVHGLDANTLFAVGAEDFQVGGTAVPRVFRFDAASGHWVRESLPAEAGSGYLHGVSVVDGGLAYAVGDQGLALLRQDGTWRKLPPPTGTPAPDLLDVIAFHSTVVYAVSDDSGSYILRYNGTAWSAPIQPDAPLLSLDATGPQEVWASGNSEMWVRWGSQNP